SSITIKKNNALLTQLPFNNKQAFKDAERGFIAPLPNNGIIKNNQGEIIWNLSEFNFINKAKRTPPTVNPSLWRQSKLIIKGGLYKVTAHIYQVRAADLSNITFIEGPNGIVIVDPLISTETAQAALNLYFQHRPKKPIVAVIYTHSHVDHFGGVRGVISAQDVKDGKIKIVAPKGFLKSAISENVIAGNVMSRRASYMYGNLLTTSPTGQVGAGLGPTTSIGTISLLAPTVSIDKNFQTLTLAGLKFIFYLAPDSEAPAEMFFYIPKYKALCTAEDATHTLHNTYSLRGTKIRDPLLWSKYLNEVLYLWGDKAQVLFAPHHWPVWGQADIVKHLRLQRDLYRYIHDQTLRLANEGFTKTQIAEMIQLPKSLAQHWSNRGYYGTMNHNVKATYVKYLGWFNGNPATLHELPPVAASKRYVEYMGGADAILQKARKDYAAGHYRWVAQVLNHVVFADPNNQAARNLEADALEQLGYQAESGPWRNFYLTGAKELREGVKRFKTPATASPDILRAIDLDLLFDYLAVRLNADKAADKKIVLNLEFSDPRQEYILELDNGTLHHIQGVQAKNADATIQLKRETLNQILLKKITLQQAIASGAIKISGNAMKFIQLFSLLDKFDFWFNIVTPNVK
ncbi:MAG: alkyl sulfatase dimerization domain-containing protein, partial [Pseudomonadota bacterium]